MVKPVDFDALVKLLAERPNVGADDTSQAH
jgi:hypothetical protein